MEQVIDQGFGREIVAARGHEISVEALLQDHPRKSGAFLFAVDMIYLMVAIGLAAAFCAMLAIAAPLALAFGALAGLFLGGEAPRAWQPVRAR